ncbi:DUF2061 domain-containing protein [Halobaculum rarum]|uniref:DUF2061 domain-containing protein n=1 Tax=Halobaculum rarum TaxID=3075122 RepID=UPI0032AFBB72
MVAIAVIVAWIGGGDASDAVNMGLVANVVRTGTYYTYERLWDQIAWDVADTA